MGDRQSFWFDQDLLCPPKREGISEVAGDFTRSIVYGAIQGPVDGISQLVDKCTGSKLLPALHLVEHPDEQKFGTTRWHAQQLGGAIGMAAPLLLLHRSVSHFGAKQLGQCIASTTSENCLSSEIKNSITTGALYGALLIPSSEKEDFASARLKSAATSGITFGAFNLSSAGIRSLTSRLCPTLAETHAARIVSSSVAGIPAGIISAKTDAVLHGRNANTEDLLTSAYSFAVVGGALSMGQSMLSRKADIANLSPKQADKTEQVSYTPIDPVLNDQVQKLNDHFHRKPSNGASSPEPRTKEILRSDRVLDGTPVDSELSSQVQKLYNHFHQKRADSLERTAPIAKEDPISPEANKLLEKYHDAVKNQTSDIPESKARQACFDAAKRIRFSDVWLDMLPEDALRISGKDRMQYWQYLSRKFESRAELHDISPRRQAETFSQIERLLRPNEKTLKSELTPSRLRQLAREILENVANPNKIDQGSHPTCVLNSIESVMASNHPEKYARLVADLGLTGESYKNGIGIKLPERCMIPDKEAREVMRKDGERCFASQLTQYYLANLHWSQCTELPTGDFAEPGTVTYEPMNGRANRAAIYVDGEPLKITGTKHGKEGSVYIPVEAPEVLDNYIVPLFRQVVPRGQIKVIDHIDGIDKFTDHNGRRTVTTIKTADDLEQALLNSKRGSVICGVRSELLGGDNGWHATVIRDFDAEAGAVYVDNSWGQAAHHNGKRGQQYRLTINELFKLMEPAKEGK